jgi:hypothetical protein
MFGLSRDYLRDAAKTNNVVWWVDRYNLNMRDPTTYSSSEAVVLNSATGMIGWPHVEIDGVYVRALINPKIRPGTRLQINNKSIVQAQQQFSITKGAIAHNEFTSSDHMIDQDGMYIVLVCDFQGDTRGNAWWMDLICKPESNVGPVTGVVLGTK